jgi:hypothetical protein
MQKKTKQVRYVVRKKATVKDGETYKPMTVLPRFLSKLYDYSVYCRDRSGAF